MKTIIYKSTQRASHLLLLFVEGITYTEQLAWYHFRPISEVVFELHSKVITAHIDETLVSSWGISIMSLELTIPSAAATDRRVVLPVQEAPDVDRPITGSSCEDSRCVVH